jgi:hypothetical protein
VRIVGQLHAVHFAHRVLGPLNWYGRCGPSLVGGGGEQQVWLLGGEQDGCGAGRGECEWPEDVCVVLFVVAVVLSSILLGYASEQSSSVPSLRVASARSASRANGIWQCYLYLCCYCMLVTATPVS